MLDLQFPNQVQIESSRLILRKIEIKDAVELFALRSNPVIMKYIDRPPLADVEEATMLIQKMQNDFLNNQGINWAITLKPSDLLIGSIGFWRIDKENHRTEIGYMLQSKHQGKGIMSEAMDLAISFAFEVMKVHSIEANTNPQNEASIQLLLGKGFEQEAYFKEHYYFDGKFLDSAIFSLLERKFKPGKTSINILELTKNPSPQLQ